MRWHASSAPWPFLLAAACAPAVAPVSDPQPNPSAEPASEHAHGLDAAHSAVEPRTSAEAVPVPTLSAPTTPPTPLAIPKHHDCDSGGSHKVCVSPGETTGALVGKGPCREAPKQDVCRGCRPVFSALIDHRCCYEGLSRFPACKDDTTF